ncbi:uncharacterized protein Z520_04437 [Fonsecaea multimorphosa CBS 102226]|uniref:Glucose-methanol-choline oxidoreductase N-terminal domain-containing protein n=1 Tax=Fonsecaea multimorphosa CBS 102226 TaxID=1442371 RepID=A0A0D2IS22_9EURO|nr:uncharacterized protein Z520_04437 [Fonsecaea multimorphosa CBS 102226]KIX99801.1 hypothetical protein Z520_04437 [Fonsecaea multimorphosa CBS 102226]OAL26524.1 hypothetical protein AYO22_04199 [Fonsecaea multimorphosa]
MASSSYDYVIVGGGVAGLVLASRLSKLLPPTDNKRILVLEAGTDPSTTDHILTSQGLHIARESPHSYQLSISPNRHLNGRGATVPVGKALGGSAAINGGAWTRGPKSDYDLWAKIVGDDSWGYDALLPYMRRVESMVVLEGVVEKDETQHGYDGPLKLTPIRSLWPARKYPLRESVQKMWEEAGVKYIPDGNAGDQNGLVEFVEVWVNSARQLPSKILDLTKVDVRTMSTVQRVTFGSVQGQDQPVANGVDLVGGEHVVANKEVVVCAGAYHTPQILMLSGVGDPAELAKHGIKTIASNREVGRNLADHLGMGITWKLKHPEKGLSIGSPLFVDPSYFSGWPMDFIEFGALDELARLEPLIKTQEDRDLLLRPDASHMEIATLYAAMGKRFTGLDAPLDGSYISTVVAYLTSTSRGSITLRSASVEDPPVIDTNLFDTDADRFGTRESLRKAASVHLETEAGRSFISHEVAPEGYACITKATTDEEIDKRIAEFGYSFDHPMGSCAMGKAVDSHCRVIGVRGLRVVDASVFPVPMACHPQSVVYATAERVADWIGNGD